MKKLLLRIAAFALDTLLVSLVALLLSYISFINPNLDDLNVAYDELALSEQAYQEFDDKLDEYLEDGVFSDEELADINNIYPDYSEVFADIEINTEIENADKEEITNAMSERHVEVYNSYAYRIQKYSVFGSIATLILTLLYFGVLQYILKGQTLFKRLFRLRVVDKDKNNKRVSLWRFIVRSIIINELVFILIDIITVLTLKESAYIGVNAWLYQIRYIYEMLMIIVLIIRDDQRGLHDLAVNTRVILLDKNGKEVEVNPIFADVSETKTEEVENTNEPKEKGRKRKQREVVKAEKVDS